jgi:hypothetical protein
VGLPRGVRIITARQARAARCVLDLSAQGLASKSGVSASSIRRAEDGTVSLDLLARLQEFYEGQGLDFRWETEKCGLLWPKSAERDK